MESLGIDLKALDGLADSPFTARAKGDGSRSGIVEAVAIGLAIAILQDAAYAAAKKLWQRVVKPYFESRTTVTESRQAGEDAED